MIKSVLSHTWKPYPGWAWLQPNLIRYVIFVCVHFITYKNKANLVAALAMIFNFLIPMDPDNSALKSAGLVNAAPRIPGREHHSL